MKKLIGFLLLCFLLLCSASAGYCSGKIEDGDAYETYYGKSKSIVRVIAPDRHETSDGELFTVDSIETENNGYISLIVDFKETDTVQVVFLLIDTNTAKTYFDGDLIKLFAYNLSVMGLDPANLTEVHEMDEGTLVWGLIDDSIFCVSKKEDLAYMSNCHPY